MAERSLRYFPAFERDVQAVAAYLAQEADRSVALRFLKQLEMPEAGQRYGFMHPRLQNIRRRAIPGFGRHIIFYQVCPETVDMLHLYHAARDIDLLFAAEAP